MPQVDRPIISFLKTQDDLIKQLLATKLTAAIHIYKFKNIRCKTKKVLNLDT